MKTRSQQTLRIIQAASELLDPEQPMTLRHLYYLLVSSGDLHNSQKDYDNLIRVTGQARKRGELPFDGLIDNMRGHIKPSSWSGLSDFTQETAETYRKNLWANQKDYIEIWCEKDAISGVIGDVTWEYDVHLRPTRGYPSLTFLYGVADELTKIGKPIHIYYLGDHDPSGLDIERSCRQELDQMLMRSYARSLLAEEDTFLQTFEWKRLGLNENDFDNFNIIPLPAKRSDKRFMAFHEEYGTEAAELDALPPDELRRRVREAIESHINQEEWKQLQKIEAVERETYQKVVQQFRNGKGR